MMLDSLVTASGVTLVKDQHEAHADLLMQRYLTAWCEEKRNASRPILVMSFSRTAEDMREAVGAAGDQRVTFIDGFSDREGWRNLSPAEGVRLLRGSCTAAAVMRVVEQVLPSRQREAAVLVQGGCSMALEHGPAELQELFHVLRERLDMQRSAVVAFVHADVLGSTEVHALEHRLDTVVDVQRPRCMLGPEGSAAAGTAQLQAEPAPHHRLVVIRHARPSGRVAWAYEAFGEGPDGKLEQLAVPKSVAAAVSAAQTAMVAKLDPAANLTFNMSLTEEEKAAKDDVVLPYMHHLSAEPVSTGVIYYDEESDDDFDEEDPDDDLDL